MKYRKYLILGFLVLFFLLIFLSIFFILFESKQDNLSFSYFYNDILEPEDLTGIYINFLEDEENDVFLVEEFANFSLIGGYSTSSKFESYLYQFEKEYIPPTEDFEFVINANYRIYDNITTLDPDYVFYPFTPKGDDIVYHLLNARENTSIILSELSDYEEFLIDNELFVSEGTGKIQFKPVNIENEINEFRLNFFYEAGMEFIENGDLDNCEIIIPFSSKSLGVHQECENNFSLSVGLNKLLYQNEDGGYYFEPVYVTGNGIEFVSESGSMIIDNSKIIFLDDVYDFEIISTNGTLRWDIGDYVTPGRRNLTIDSGKIVAKFLGIPATVNYGKENINLSSYSILQVNTTSVDDFTILGPTGWNIHDTDYPTNVIFKGQTNYVEVNNESLIEKEDKSKRYELSSIFTNLALALIPVIIAITRMNTKTLDKSSKEENIKEKANVEQTNE